MCVKNVHASMLVGGGGGGGIYFALAQISCMSYNMENGDFICSTICKEVRSGVGSNRHYLKSLYHYTIFVLYQWVVIYWILAEIFKMHLRLCVCVGGGVFLDVSTLWNYIFDYVQVQMGIFIISWDYYSTLSYRGYFRLMKIKDSQCSWVGCLVVSGCRGHI